MVLPVGHDLVAEHGAHGVVPDVVGDPDAAAEELHGQVLVVTCITCACASHHRIFF